MRREVTYDDLCFGRQDLIKKRTGYFLLQITLMVAVTLIWTWLYQPAMGRYDPVGNAPCAGRVFGS